MSEQNIDVLVERISNLDTKVTDGFKGVHDRQDKTNGRIGTVENRTSGLETFRTQITSSLAIFKWLFGFLGIGNLIMFLNTLMEIL
jgi:hypothetical protein